MREELSHTEKCDRVKENMQEETSSGKMPKPLEKSYTSNPKGRKAINGNAGIGMLCFASAVLLIVSGAAVWMVYHDLDFDCVVAFLLCAGLPFFLIALCGVDDCQTVPAEREEFQRKKRKFEEYLKREQGYKEALPSFRDKEIEIRGKTLQSDADYRNANSEIDMDNVNM